MEDKKFIRDTKLKLPIEFSSENLNKDYIGEVLFEDEDNLAIYEGNILLLDDGTIFEITLIHLNHLTSENENLMVWTIPNVITGFRLVLAPFVVWSICLSVSAVGVEMPWLICSFIGLILGEERCS